MHIQSGYGWIKHIDFIAINLFSLVFCFVISFFIKFDTLTTMFTQAWSSLLIILCLTNLVITLVTTPYSKILTRPYYADAIKLFSLPLYSFIVVAVLFYLFKVGGNYSRIMLMVTFVSYYLVSLLLLWLRKHMIITGKTQFMKVRKKHLLAIANPNELKELRAALNSGEIKEYEIAACCFPQNENEREYTDDGISVIKKADVTDYVLGSNIDDVYISVPIEEIDIDTYRTLVRNGVNVHIDIESLIGIPTDNQFISSVGGFTTLSVGSYVMEGGQAFYLIIKRVLDIVFGLIGCALLIPVAIVVKTASLLAGEKDSIIYTHTRIGRFGKPFQLYKFRSMIPNADKALQEMLENDEYREQWENNQKIDDDPRITKVGTVLRKSSLDELPQFINVIKGEMSLVGPRPLVAGELEKHNGLALYNKIKPGITGWWSCNGRSDISYRERLELEYYYVKNFSLYLDAVTVFRTIAAVVRRKGAM